MIKSGWTVTRSGKKLSDGLTAPIECLHCGHKFEFKIVGNKTDPLVECPACHKKTQIESGGTLQKAAAELESLDRAWENLFKN